MNMIKKYTGNRIMLFARRQWFWIVSILILLILPIPIHSKFMVTLISEMCIAIVFALSYNMLMGQGGMLSFGHAVLFGLGGFTVTHGLNMVTKGGLPVPLELIPLIGAFFGLIFGGLMGYISTRKSGTTFALISMGIVELIAACALLFPSFFGGEEGIATNRMLDFTLTGLRFGKDIEVYYLIIFWMVISGILMYLQTQTPLGRMANAVRDNPERSLFVGYNTHHVRFFQFAMSGLFAGIAGGLFAINYEIVTSEVVGALFSGKVLLMAYIGGVGHFFGPIIGALLYTFLEVTLASVTEAWQLYLGLMFVMMVLWAPNGIAGLLVLHQPLKQRRMLHRMIKPYLRALVPGLILFTGVILLVEINYHLSLSIDPEAPMHMLGLTFQADSWLAWLVAFVAIVAGGVMLRPAMKIVTDRWNELMEEIKGGQTT
jgi:branched-chain amino acid transport system permease protein